jgi:hypothetical protein
MDGRLYRRLLHRLGRKQSGDAMNKGVHTVGRLAFARHKGSHLNFEHREETSVVDKASLIESRYRFGACALALLGGYFVDAQVWVNRVDGGSNHIPTLIGLDHDALGVPLACR